MLPDAARGIDWRDAAPYARLLGADRSILAWEWLRRDPSYCAAAKRFRDGAAERAESKSWGLHGFEEPSKAAPAARPIWRADHHPFVLAAAAEGPAPASDAIDISSLSSLVTLVVGPKGDEHLLLSDGQRAIRLDIVAGSVTSGPVRLHYALAGLASAKRPLLTLRRLLSLTETGRFSRTLHPPEPSARRWILALRAHDALASGASQRMIAAVLLGEAAGEARWRVQAASLRSQAQRLVRAARMLASGGYRALLL